MRQSALDREVPLGALLELTYRCNLRCRHCYLEGLPASPEPELSTARVLGVLEELAALGALYLNLSGGEPLLRPDLWEILETAAERGFVLRLFSNGTLLDGEGASRLGRLATVALDVSLHGARAESHDWMTRCPGSFDRALAGVRLARDQGVPVTLKTPLTRRNLPEREAIMELAAGLGVDARFDPTVTARNCGDRDTLCLRLDHRELVDLYRGEGAGASPAGSEGLTCAAGLLSVVVTPTGVVRPCVQLLLDCGRLSEQSFSEIWRSSPTLKRLRRLTDEDVVGCATCARREACNRCPGLALLEDGDLLGPSSAACAEAAAWAEVLALDSAPSPARGAE